MASNETFVFSFLRHPHADFCKCYSSFRAHQQCRRLFFSCIFPSMGSFLGPWCQPGQTLNAVLICMFLNGMEIEWISCIYEPTYPSEKSLFILIVHFFMGSFMASDFTYLFTYFSSLYILDTSPLTEPYLAFFFPILEVFSSFHWLLHSNGEALDWIILMFCFVRYESLLWANIWPQV